jgi:hypothetical protein
MRTCPSKLPIPLLAIALRCALYLYLHASDLEKQKYFLRMKIANFKSCLKVVDFFANLCIYFQEISEALLKENFPLPIRV